MKSTSKFRFLRMFCILAVVFLATTCQKETKRDIVPCDYLRIQTVQGWVTSPGWLIDAINSRVDTYPTAQSGWRPYPYVYTFEYAGQNYILVFDPWEGDFLARAIFFTCEGERIYVEQPAIIGWNDNRNRMIVIGGGLWGQLYNHVIFRAIMSADRGIVNSDVTTLVWRQPFQPTTSTCQRIVTNANGWITSPAWLRHVIDSLRYCGGGAPMIYSIRHNEQDYFYFSGGGSFWTGLRFHHCTGEPIRSPDGRPTELTLELNAEWYKIIEAGKEQEHLIWRRPQ